ncbi:MAG: hypothetical protein NZ869_07375 [Thermoanaerobaculum sp.]|nr:hypothetical protein [Thermoanaerobaculum sp.]MDW7967159.1 hypothetical protein [Thermoanaerobaculum sp.]
MGLVLRHLLGWTFILLGVVGSLLPILQGWLFFAAGALLLAPEVPVFRRLFCWIEQRFPALKKPLGQLRRRFDRKSSPCQPEE